MFKSTKQIESRYAVKLADGSFLLQGKKGMKLFRSRERADKARDDPSASVVEVSLGEVSYLEPSKSVDTSGIQSLLSGLSEGVSKASSVDLYKMMVTSFGGCNVLRHTPLGEKPVAYPGDTYIDIEVTLQMRMQR